MAAPIKEFPKPHISFSAMTAFEKSPKQWYKRYVLGEKMYETKHLQKGKEFAQALEDEESEDVIIASMLPYIEKLESQEVEVSAPFENDIFPGLKLLGKKDTATDVTEIGEYKAGSVPWDQAKVDKHGQTVFYALIDRINGAVKLPKVWYQWFEVLKDAETGEVEFTGKFEKFNKKVTEADIKRMVKRILKVLAEISVYEYEETLDVDDAIMKRYSRLDRLEKAAKAEKDKIKVTIERMLKISGLQAAESDSGKLYMKNSSTKYTYTAATIKKMEALDKVQLQERETGAATKVVTQSLTWQPGKPKKE